MTAPRRDRWLLEEYIDILSSLGFNAETAATIVKIAYREMKKK
jgi:hypothetical protein